MKRLKKKVVIGTTAGLASLVLNACGVYGPPTEHVAAPEPAGPSSQEISVQDVTDESTGGNDMTDSKDSAAFATSSAASESSISVSGASNDDNTGAKASESSSTGSSKISFTKVPSDSSSIASSLSEEYIINSDDIPEYEYPIEVPAVYGPPLDDK